VSKNREKEEIQMKRSYEGNRVREINREHLEAVEERELEREASLDHFQREAVDGDGFGEQQGSSGDSLPLADVVRRLSRLVGDLKDQLKDLVKINEALESDLEQTRSQVTKGAEEREILLIRLQEAQDESAAMEDLKSETGQLARERDTLAGKVRDLGWMLATSEQRVEETSELLDKFRTERNDACKEAECLNSQFSRAMKVIGELKSSLADNQETELKQKERIDFLDKKLVAAVKQRDACKQELTKSRDALEEVRQSIIAASRESR
jgi:chromosome segregation ATPase